MKPVFHLVVVWVLDESEHISARIRQCKVNDGLGASQYCAAFEVFRQHNDLRVQITDGSGLHSPSGVCKYLHRGSAR